MFLSNRANNSKQVTNISKKSLESYDLMPKGFH